MKPTISAAIAAVSALFVASCGGGGSPPPPPVTTTCPAGQVGTPPNCTTPVNLDGMLRPILAAQGLTGDPTTGRNLPDISDPLAQLGKKLFFSKSLSGDLDVACASCHHPALGGADGLSLPVGVGAVDPDVVGPGRSRADGLPNVGRHSQSVFNVGLFDSSLFWDSRVESIGKEAGMNGAGSGIRTPDTAMSVQDPNAGANLVAAQARFPVAVESEMRGSLLPGEDGDAVRDRLAARIGDYGGGQGELANNSWLAEFQTAFASSANAETLITFENIALAIGEYQRSMVFVNTPWKAYVEGDNSAISDLAKEGALLFFGDAADERLECSSCHSGDFFTDEDHHTIGFPQVGIGKGDAATGDDDFGREQQTGDNTHRYRFRTPTLLNNGLTAPYGHAGSYRTLTLTSGHYAIPEDTVDSFFDSGGTCSLEQFAFDPDCATLFPNSEANTSQALAKALLEQTSDPDHTFPDISFSPLSDATLVVAFLETLNDPCASDRACLAPWIPEPGEAPDDHQLNAVDENGNPL